MNIAAYGIAWIPVSFVESFLKTKWKLLDYTSNKMEYEEVANAKPNVVLSFLPPEEIRSIPTIEWILTPGAGIDVLPLEKIKEAKQKLVNSHANAGTVAEHAWALLLAASRKITKYDNAVRSTASWPARGQIHDINIDLSNKSIGIVGFGAIGRKIAKFAQSFNMEVMIFRRNPDENQFHSNELQKQAENLDFLVLACPLTKETRLIVNRDVITQLPSHAIIVNIARGELIDEGALFWALGEGELRAAALDVWQNSPYQISDKGIAPKEFVDIPNLIISPHRAWVSKEAFALVAKQLAKDLDTIAKGGTPENLVDLERTY